METTIALILCMTLIIVVYIICLISYRYSKLELKTELKIARGSLDTKNEIICRDNSEINRLNDLLKELLEKNTQYSINANIKK